MPLFGGICECCGQPVYFWVQPLDGHIVASASLVLYPEQPNDRGVINTIHDIQQITGVHVHGLPERRRIERHNAHPGVPRVQRSATLWNGETIDLTAVSSGEEEGDETASQGLLHEGGDAP